MDYRLNIKSGQNKTWGRIPRMIESSTELRYSAFSWATKLIPPCTQLTFRLEKFRNAFVTSAIKTSIAFGH